MYVNGEICKTFIMSREVAHDVKWHHLVPPADWLFVFVCIRIEEKDVETEKEAAMEAELKAARERAVVPQEARMSQFKDMLLERGVNRYILYKQKQMTRMGTFLLIYTVKNLRSKCLNYLSYKYKFHRQLSVASTDVFLQTPIFYLII